MAAHVVVPNQIVVARQIVVDGQVVEPGVTLSELRATHPSVTESWVSDAIACGHLRMSEPDPSTERIVDRPDVRPMSRRDERSRRPRGQ